MALTKISNTVTTLAAEDVGLGNVTNESKETMFTNPAFTGTPTGITATHVGLGNVTNESKETMFTSPTFTGTTTMAGIQVKTISTTVNNGTIGLDPTPTVSTIDTFATNAVRTAVYHLQSNDPTYGYQYSKLTLIHDGTTVTLIENDVVFTRSTQPYMVYDCAIASGTATVTGTAFAGSQQTVIKGWVELIGV
jgi:hypothetical protein